MSNSMQDLISSFTGTTALIIGDVMVDRYFKGNVERISPEAPVPVVSIQNEESRLGGAANVALNVKGLGATPILCAIYGDDDAGKILLERMAANELSTDGLLATNRLTTVKTRVVGNNHQMLRVDQEDDSPVDANTTDQLKARVSALLDQQNVDVIIFEDYDKGVITADLIEHVVKEAKQKGIPTTVDPKRRNFNAYRGVTLFKPNLKELREGAAIEVDPTDMNSLAAACESLRSSLRAESLFVTLSEHGVFISNTEERHLIPAHVRNISDVSGAGDTVISVASLALAKGANLQTIAELSNLAGGFVCEKVGVTPITQAELATEIEARL